LSAIAESEQTFIDAIVRIADELAAPNADDVDRNARFPREAVNALRQQKAFSALVPPELGGGGLSIDAVARACFELGRRCGATGMVFAMHQIQVACIVRHLDGSAWFEAYLRRLAAEQRLIASVTSEVGTGGDLGSSVAAVETSGSGECSFEKQAPTVSYGGEADDLLTTLRRSPDAEPGDQVAVLTTRDQHELEQKGTWDPLGMRGTCSPGFVVKARFPTEQILPTPFPTISAESMVPISHITWSHVWLGIARDAFDRSRAFVRESAKRKPGEPLPVAARLSHLMSQLSLLRSEVDSGLRDFLAMDASPGRERLSTVAAAVRFNNLKVATSEQAPRVCQDAMKVGGIVAYKNDTPFSIGRHLRDTMSASLMVANERIHQTNASLLLIAKEV
jgi:acyl-CoA dehydrogenase